MTSSVRSASARSTRRIAAFGLATAATTACVTRVVGGLCVRATTFCVLTPLLFLPYRCAHFVGTSYGRMGRAALAAATCLLMHLAALRAPPRRRLGSFCRFVCEPATSRHLNPTTPPPSPSSSFKKATRAAASAPRPALRGDASVVRAAAAPTLAPRVEVVPSQTRQAANDSVQSIDQIRARLAARARDAIERAPEQQQQQLLQQQQQQQVIPATMTTTHVRLSSLAPAALTPAEEKLLGTLGKMQRLGLLRAGSTAEALFRQLSRQST